MKYIINYHTGAGNQTITGTLENARQIADQGAAYTGKNITIEDETGVTVALRPWWPVPYSPDEGEQESPICFGDSGYYGDWQER